MKVLSLNVKFLLPEDFQGDFTDAIEEYVKYRRENPEVCPAYADGECKEEEFFPSETSHWDQFLDATQEGFHAVGAGSVQRYDPTTDEWYNIRKPEDTEPNETLQSEDD